MYYVCIEDDKITSVLNYEPTVPDSISVYEITDQENDSLKNRTHYFDIAEGCVKPNPKEKDAELAREKYKNESLANLSQTDWKVLRHIREKALGITPSLSDDEYIALETLRQGWVESIRAN